MKYSAALYPFGTTVFTIPPRSASSVTHDCTVDQDMEAFVMFPHMHRLGKSMAFRRSDLAALGGFEAAKDYLANPQAFEPHMAPNGRASKTPSDSASRTPSGVVTVDLTDGHLASTT